MVIKRGFTLIELIVVIGLLGLLAVAISGIMLASLVSSSNIRSATKVKQAGSYVIGQVQNLMRNAKTVVACDNVNQTITVVNPDGGQTEIMLESARIASNSGNYLTPPNLTVSAYSLQCDSVTSPNLLKFSFDLKDPQSARASTPALHFETSVNFRNQ